MKNTIAIGTKITTIYGYEEVTAIYGYEVVTSIGKRGSIVDTDSYHIDEDGNPVLDGHRILTLSEIAHLMEEVDGHQHTVCIEEETTPHRKDTTMKNIITIGTDIDTICGYEQVTGYSNDIVYTDSYEINEDGDAVKTGSRRLTLNEIARLMTEVDGQAHSVGFEDKEEDTMNKIWYAAMRDREDDDWGFGSYDLDEAIRMAKGLGNESYIAVISEGPDKVCIDEIEIEHDPYYVIDNSPLEGYGTATQYDSMEDAARVVEEHLDSFNSTPTICEFTADDEFTGLYWEYTYGAWHWHHGFEEERSPYRVKAEFADTFYGNADSDVVEDWQANGIPAAELARLSREWGDLTDQLEEI